MTTKYIILGLLNYKPMHGYELKQIFERSVSYVWTINYGRLYPLLKEMEREGLIERVSIRQENKRGKIVYSITQTGKEDFAKWLSEPAFVKQIKDEFYLKMMFFSYTPKESALSLVNNQISEVKRHYITLSETKKEHGEDMDPFLALYLDAGIMRFETDLKWLGIVKDKLESNSD
ncbi:MAG: PadR family transcriptional regulator [Dethiobacter sp.]|jgi:DNA-binding PadR family transcriptional regulator|nr:PadR family transcriptional regulator [Dethiobacter sp.]